jgi:hypothetical protein
MGEGIELNIFLTFQMAVVFNMFEALFWFNAAG